MGGAVDREGATAVDDTTTKTITSSRQQSGTEKSFEQLERTKVRNEKGQKSRLKHSLLISSGRRPERVVSLDVHPIYQKTLGLKPTCSTRTRSMTPFSSKPTKLSVPHNTSANHIQYLHH
eukprot:scaffold12698_cov207-Alexandrium_tamarense.AAC.12